MIEIGAGRDAEVEQSISVSSPALLSLDAPHLYRAEVELVSGGFYGAVRAVKPFME